MSQSGAAFGQGPAVVTARTFRAWITTGLVRDTIALPAFLFAIGGITHSGGQAGGANPMRDIPRFVAMLDSGRFDAKALVTRVVGLKDMLDAYEEVAYRTTVTAIMTGQ